MGTGFPTINVGAMGAVQGQELGLASGILNTSRQLGVAIGVALLVATFSQTLHWHTDSAVDDVADIAQEYQVPPAIFGGLMHQRHGGICRRRERPLTPRPGFDEQVFRVPPAPRATRSAGRSAWRCCWSCSRSPSP